MDTVFFRTVLATINCKYVMYLADIYFYLRYIHLSGTVIVSERHLQWSRVLCFFGKSTCSHSFFQSHFEIPICSHPYDDRPLFIIKEQLQPRILSNLLCFYRIGIAARRYHKYHKWYILGFRHAYIERRLLCYDIISSHPFFLWLESLFHGSAWGNPYVKDTVFISQHLLQPSIMTSSLWLIRENLKGMFIWGKPL